MSHLKEEGISLVIRLPSKPRSPTTQFLDDIRAVIEVIGGVTRFRPPNMRLPNGFPLNFTVPGQAVAAPYPIPQSLRPHSSAQGCCSFCCRESGGPRRIWTRIP